MPEHDESASSLFRASTRLHINWLSANITLYDFSLEGDHLVSVFHSHKCMELLVVQSGNGVMHVYSEPPIPLEGGSLMFINQDISHNIEACPVQPLKTFLIMFMLEPCTSTEKIPSEWINDEKMIIDKVLGNQWLHTKDRCGCLQELEYVLRSSETRKIGELVKIKNYLSSLIMSAFQSFANLPTRADFENVLLNAPILSTSRIIKYIREHFTENITLTSVAESLYYSPRQCQRIIQDNLGISFSDYLTDLRMEYAKKLLLSMDYSMEKIAELCGFKNGKSFSRLFQARKGITPYRYQREHPKTNLPPESRN